MFLSKETKNRPEFDTVQLTSLCLDLFAAGSDTSSSTLSWALLHLALHPAVQERCHQEAAAVLGPGEEPRLEHGLQLHYCQACTVLYCTVLYCTVLPGRHCRGPEAGPGGRHLHHAQAHHPGQYQKPTNTYLCLLFKHSFIFSTRSQLDTCCQKTASYLQTIRNS